MSFERRYNERSTSNESSSQAHHSRTTSTMQLPPSFLLSDSHYSHCAFAGRRQPAASCTQTTPTPGQDITPPARHMTTQSLLQSLRRTVMYSLAHYTSIYYAIESAQTSLFHSIRNIYFPVSYTVSFFLTQHSDNRTISRRTPCFAIPA